METNIELQAIEEVDEDFIPNSNSPFRQQKVPACKPFLTPLYAAIIYGIFSLISLAIGASIFVSSNNLYEEKFEYPNDQTFKKTIVLNKNVKDLYIYYQLDGFMQNHMAYTRSKSWDQLKKGTLSENPATCEPRQTDEDGKIMLPCGSVPSSMFDDKIEISAPGYKVSETGIVHKSYKNVFTTNVTKKVEDKTKYHIIEENLQNEHFLNWMLISPTTQTRKLYAKIEGEVKKDTEIQFTIDSHYKTNGKFTKEIVLATTNFLGGKNSFFGIFFIVLCVLSAVASVVFLTLHFLNALPLYQCKKNKTTLDVTLIS